MRNVDIFVSSKMIGTPKCTFCKTLNSQLRVEIENDIEVFSITLCHDCSKELNAQLETMLP